MLEMGHRQPGRLRESITGSRDLDAGALLDYLRRCIGGWTNKHRPAVRLVS
jgi:hypothetical protein